MENVIRTDGSVRATRAPCTSALPRWGSPRDAYPALSSRKQLGKLSVGLWCDDCPASVASQVVAEGDVVTRHTGLQTGTE